MIVRFPIEPLASVFRSSVHRLFVVAPCRNSCFCSPDRNLKNLVIENSSVPGSPLSKLAPASPRMEKYASAWTCLPWTGALRISDEGNLNVAFEGLDLRLFSAENSTDDKVSSKERWSPLQGVQTGLRGITQV